MRYVCLAVALLLSVPVVAQDEKRPVKKKQVAAKKVAGKKTAHQKPTPEQIRKFNELQKKQ